MSRELLQRNRVATGPVRDLVTQKYSVPFFCSSLGTQQEASRQMVLAKMGAPESNSGLQVPSSYSNWEF